MDRSELAQQFNEAAESRQQEDQVSPGISAAQENESGREGLEGTSLGDAPLATKEFNQAANDPVDREFETQQPEVEHAPAPGMDGPAPPASTGAAQDSMTFDEKQQAVHEATGNDELYEQWAEDLENRQDAAENVNVNDGKENGGLDDGIDQD